MIPWLNVAAFRRLQALDKVWVHDVTLGGRGCVSGLSMKAGFMTLRALCNLVGSFVAIWRTRSDRLIGHCRSDHRRNELRNAHHIRHRRSSALVSRMMRCPLVSPWVTLSFPLHTVALWLRRCAPTSLCRLRRSNLFRGGIRAGFFRGILHEFARRESVVGPIRGGWIETDRQW